MRAAMPFTDDRSVPSNLPMRFMAAVVRDPRRSAGQPGRNFRMGMVNKSLTVPVPSCRDIPENRETGLLP